MALLCKEDLITTYHRSSRLLSMIGRQQHHQYYEISKDIIMYFQNIVKSFHDSSFAKYPMFIYLFEIYRLFNVCIVKEKESRYMIEDIMYRAILSIHHAFVSDIKDLDTLFLKQQHCQPKYLDVLESISYAFEIYIKEHS